MCEKKNELDFGIGGVGPKRGGNGYGGKKEKGS